MKTARHRAGAATDGGHSGRTPGKAEALAASRRPTEIPQPAPSGPPDVDGRLIGGRYRLEALVGIGGSASVWRAEDLYRKVGGERDVAVKLLHPYLVPDGTSRGRLLAEADTLRRLDHPGIVQLRDVVLDGAEAALVFDYVSGGSLAAELDRERRLDPRRAAALAAGVAAALDYAHGRGVVHRDVTPSNVLIDAAGGPRLADFGIARLLEERVPVVTATGTVLGTLRYMAPEHLGGEHADARADVYSLGAVLYEMLAGRPAFDARTPVGLVGQQAAGPPPLPEDVPPPLAAVALAAMRREPAFRPPDAAGLRAALESWLRREPVDAVWLRDTPTTDRIEVAAVRSRADVPAVRSGAEVSAVGAAIREAAAPGTPKRGTIRAIPALAPAARVARPRRATRASTFAGGRFTAFAGDRTRAAAGLAATLGLALAVATALGFVGGSTSPVGSSIAAAPRATSIAPGGPAEAPTVAPPAATQPPASTASPPPAAPVVVRATPIAAAPAPARVLRAQASDGAHANRGHHGGHGRGGGNGGEGNSAGNGGDGNGGGGGGGGD